jgi:hypothetical protein
LDGWLDNYLLPAGDVQVFLDRVVVASRYVLGDDAIHFRSNARQEVKKKINPMKSRRCGGSTAPRGNL